MISCLAACGAVACKDETSPAADSGAALDAAVFVDAAADGGLVPADTGIAVHDDAAIIELDAGVDAGMAANRDASIELVYVGSGDGNIYRYQLDRAAGTLTARDMIMAGTNPSFLAFSPSKQNLYAVNESAQNGRVSAFAVDPQNGELTFLNRVSSAGRGPTHLIVDGSGRWVLVAHYTEGTAVVLPFEDQGRVGEVTETENAGENAHQIITDPANRFAFVPCKGADHIAQYSFDPAGGTLTANAVPTVATNPGAGPRHMSFHPSGAWAYVINELDSTITSYSYDADTGQLTALESISTLPAGFSDTNYPAEVFAHPNGRFVYGSNRGHDSIAIFSVDAQNGTLTLLDHAPTGGQTPRNFGLSADGAILLAANQESGDLFAFRVDDTSGALTALGRVAQVPSPQFVGILELAR